MSILLDMNEVLERLGINPRIRNQRCPECGSSTGLSINARKSIASCFACGKRYFPPPDPHDETWTVKFLTTIYLRCRRELEDPQKGAIAREYLLSRGLDAADYILEPIGVIPNAMSPEKWIAEAKRLREEEDIRITKRLSETDGRNIKLRKCLQNQLEENAKILQELEGQIRALAAAGGWLAFFYVNATQDFVSVNIRQCGGDGYKQIKPKQKGIFSPIMGDSPAAVPGEVLLVEGEFNLLTLRKAYRGLDPTFQLTSAALGTASSWDAHVVRRYFDGLEFAVNYDNDAPGEQAVNQLAETGSLWAFAVPAGNSRENDADYYIRTFGLLEYVKEWSQARKVYRSWESCKEALNAVANDELLSERDAHHAGLELVRKLLLERGTIYNCGNLCTFVDNETRDITQVEKGGLAFGVLLERLGIYAGDKFLPPDTVGKSLGAFAQRCPKNTIYTMSFYNKDKHLLYINEYGGYFLRIDGAHNVERLQNGDDGLLFTDGIAGECDPLHADLGAVLVDSICCSPLQVDGATVSVAHDMSGRDST